LKNGLKAVTDGRSRASEERAIIRAKGPLNETTSLTIDVQAMALTTRSMSAIAIFQQQCLVSTIIAPTFRVMQKKSRPNIERRAFVALRFTTSAGRRESHCSRLHKKARSYSRVSPVRQELYGQLGCQSASKS
jgi:hypothetical protein